MSRFAYIATALFVLFATSCLRAQDDDVSLGDLARQLRNSKTSESSNVIDNDNFNLVMDKAESERLEGQPIFAISHSGRTFAAISPDGTCSLTFDARTANRTPVAYIATDLPKDELLKLHGPATVEDGRLEVSLHNGTRWELTEVEIGVTALQAQSGPPEYRFATLASAPDAAAERSADPMLLYRLKGDGAPDSTTKFGTPLSTNFSESENWHWVIVGARGIPPAAPATTLPQPLAAVTTSSATVRFAADSAARSLPAVPSPSTQEPAPMRGQQNQH
jgi:hypothetical protein